MGEYELALTYSMHSSVQIAIRDIQNTTRHLWEGWTNYPLAIVIVYINPFCLTSETFLLHRFYEKLIIVRYQ